MDARITGVVLTHNEEANIVACLEHLRPHVNEIILVDTESSDSTVELARPLVDRILTYPHVPNFDAARNNAIPEAKYDWLWFVDADEQIPVATGTLVNQLIREQGETFEAINIPFKSYFCGQWMQHCGWWPGYTCPRVLKKGFGEFSRTLHGGVKLSGREVRVPPDARTGIEHYSFKSVAHWVEKFNRYTTTESLQLAEREAFWDWRLATRMMVRDLWEHYEKFNAKKDGDRGWILTWLASQYRWFSVAKLIDHDRCRADHGGPVSVPADLDEVLRVMEQELASFRTLRPELPLGVNWRAPIWSNDEIGHEARCCVWEQATGERLISLEELPARTYVELTVQERTLLKALMRVRRAKHVISITLGCELVRTPDPCAVYNVLRLVSQQTKIPSEVVHLAAAYDEIWVDNQDHRFALIKQGCAPEKVRVVAPFCSGATSLRLETEIRRIEDRFRPLETQEVAEDAIRVELEGELFAGHSFANINEQLAWQLITDPEISLSLRRARYNPVHDQDSALAPLLHPYIGRELNDEPDVVIRHSFPPNWQRPDQGKWVHIQPWEFGHLPKDWLIPLRDAVDEIWVMSRYVEEVYLRSGIAPEKLQYLPWGIDPDIYHSAAPPRDLPTKKSFRFLYVGGTTVRKGFDRLLQAFLAEFTAKDDVCLVVKDLGNSTFYRDQNYREQILAAQKDPHAPQILYFEANLTPGQLASLYTACDCLVAPYRGEGFCLPVLEAMACGLPPIVPQGGPTDDFTSEETAFRLPSRTVTLPDMPNLCGPATELEINLADLREAMRLASSNRLQTKTYGTAASQHVHQGYTWQHTAARVRHRLQALANRPIGKNHKSSDTPTLDVYLQPPRDPASLPDRLSRITPFVEQVFIADKHLTEQQRLLAREYGAEVTTAPPGEVCRLNKSPHWLLELDAEMPVEEGWTTEVWRQIAELSPEVQEINILLDSIPLRATRKVHHEEQSLIDFPVSPRETPKRKILLLQMAAGTHRELLEITRRHHESYARRHGLDYHCFTDNPVPQKRAGWGKIPLLLAALRQGYETVIWLDADAVIARSEVNLAHACSAGIGMVRHPHPEHWNSGMMVVHQSPQSIRFLETVHAQPDNNSAWMEQLPINQLASQPEFASLILPIDLVYNSVPGFAMANDPVIVAAHGMPLDQRKAILWEWLPKDSAVLQNRNELGDLLNHFGLLGAGVEVGVQRGEFSRALLDRWRGQLLHLIDPWRKLSGYEDIANLSDEDHAECLSAVHHNLAGHADRYQIHRMLSKEAVGEFAEQSLDFVYLDANHAYEAIREDLRLWYPKLKVGGILAGHDFLDGQLPEGDFGVASAVEEFQQEMGLQLNVTPERWPTWWMMKNAEPVLVRD